MDEAWEGCCLAEDAEALKFVRHYEATELRSWPLYAVYITGTCVDEFATMIRRGGALRRSRSHAETNHAIDNLGCLRDCVMECQFNM